jgi:hypothetical protein
MSSNNQTYFYAPYYQPVISARTGFKLVPGGTGLGKTSGAVETIKQHPHKKYRFFYIANRIQLLNAFAKDLDNANIGYCLQEKNESILKKIDEKIFYALLSDSTIEKYSKLLYPKTNLNIADIKEEFQFIRQHSQLASYDENNLFFNKKIQLIFRFFKQILKKAHENKAKVNWDYSDLIQQEGIKKLFPYLDFKHNPNSKSVFLVSLQKAFYGFFDGLKSVNIYDLQSAEGEQNILFLDEFDFLENDLLTQICKDTSVEDPFSFVETFYKTLTQYKLPRESFLADQPDVKQDLQNIIKLIDSLSKQGIPFPAINHFLCNDPKLKNTAIFQTRYSISNRPIYLNAQKETSAGQKINAFFLEATPQQSIANAFTLLNTVNQATSAIIRFFKKLETEQPAIYEALIKQCFRSAPHFKMILEQSHQIPFERKAVETNDSNLYYNGFGLYEIYQYNYPTDIEEVALKYYALFSTPESILLRLAKYNLVFGLSATAEITRYVKNFDLCWLRQELGNKYYEVNLEDQKRIQEATDKKAQARKQQLDVVLANEALNPKLSKVIEFVSKSPEVFGKEGAQKTYRTRRLRLFFAALLKIAQNPKPFNTHLLFFSSFKQIKYVFDAVKSPENGVYFIEPLENVLKNVYKIRFERQDFIVLFFDATQGKEIATNPAENSAYYELFLRELPVLVVTTYPSAGNGVNLFYFTDASKKHKKDFLHVHLLDSPFYFFSPIDPEKDSESKKNEKIKANIYYLTKLEQSKVVIDEQQLRIYLDKIRNIDEFNAFYKTTSDGLYSRVATYIQALGRVERVWNAMDAQTIFLEQSVYNDLQDYCTTDDGLLNRYRLDYEKNEPYFSSNLSQMFEFLIQQEPERTRRLAHHAKEGLKEQNDRCKEAIERFLKRFQSVRKNQDKVLAAKIRKEWSDLRQIALEHRFSDKLCQKFECVFNTNAFDPIEKCLWIQRETFYIVPSSEHPDSSYTEWRLNQIYQKVKMYPVLRDYFDERGYEMGFSGKGLFFTPYFYQSILLGALGEEVIKAIFPKEGVPLDDAEIDNTLFEMADTKIVGKAWYIDCKNYSERTMDYFQVEDNHNDHYHLKLNDPAFKREARKKWDHICAFHSNVTKTDCKLIYINAFATTDRLIKYLDENFETVGSNFEKATIIMIPGMLQIEMSKKKDPNYHPEFDYFMNQLKKQLNDDQNGK